MYTMNAPEDQRPSVIEKTRILARYTSITEMYWLDWVPTSSSMKPILYLPMALTEEWMMFVISRILMFDHCCPSNNVETGQRESNKGHEWRRYMVAALRLTVNSSGLLVVWIIIVLSTSSYFLSMNVVAMYSERRSRSNVGRSSMSCLKFWISQAWTIMLRQFLSLLPKSVYSHELIAKKRSPPRIWAMNVLLAVLVMNWRIFMWTDIGRDL